MQRTKREREAEGVEKRMGKGEEGEMKIDMSRGSSSVIGLLFIYFFEKCIHNKTYLCEK